MESKIRWEICNNTLSYRLKLPYSLWVLDEKGTIGAETESFCDDCEYVQKQAAQANYYIGAKARPYCSICLEMKTPIKKVEIEWESANFFLCFECAINLAKELKKAMPG